MQQIKVEDVPIYPITHGPALLFIAAYREKVIHFRSLASLWAPKCPVQEARQNALINKHRMSHGRSGMQ